MKLPKALKDLKDLKQWVGFSKIYDEQRQKYKKLPKCPVHVQVPGKDGSVYDCYGYGAKADNPDTWGTYEQAVSLAEERKNVDGIGFEFANGFAGIDLDHCVDPQTGEISEMAAEIIQMMDSYTELSPSGTGIHILCKADIPPFNGFRNDNIGLEIYNSGRYFTITGNVFGTEKPIERRTEQLKRLMDQHIRKIESPSVGTNDGFIDPYAVMDKMLQSKNGAQIRKLIEGKWEGDFQSQSNADLALCNHLAYWTNGNQTAMDEIFRMSGLYREKWDEKHGKQTYGDLTIKKALEKFIPYEKRVQSTHENTGLHENTDNIWATDKDGNIITAKESGSRFKDNPQPDSIENYVNSNRMGEDLERFRASAGRKTGFEGLDSVMGSLYPGLYAVGAISSLGKTTFIHQLSDQLAENGEHVLFFSLEQSRLELFSKGIARQSLKEAQERFKGKEYRELKYHALSAIKYRTGNYNEQAVDLPAVISRYVSAHKNVSIIEGSFNTDIDFIINYVNEYIARNNVKPIVVIDYLQIIQPDDPKQLKKDAVDSHVRALKMLQRDNDLAVFLICSLNRAAYLSPVDFESFKETGGIEYTADVVWGLDLHEMETNGIFDKAESKKQKREAIKEAKLEVPRKVDLKCLKNRYGQSSYTARFNYYPENDFFEDITDEAFEDFKVEGPRRF